MNKQEFIKTYNLTEEQFYGKTKIDDSLDLYSLTSIPEGFNPTVGGDLDLRSLTSIPEGFNPTVGGYLYLGNGLTSNYTKLNGKLLEWENGKYISVDGIFTEVISKKGNVYKVKKLNSNKEFYIVSDGNGKYSHGDDIKSAKADLIYKLGNIDKSAYADYTKDTVLSFAKAIECYRVITGACSFGTKDFVENNQIEEREYSISEIIELTNGRYGNETFKNYFVK